MQVFIFDVSNISVEQAKQYLDVLSVTEKGRFDSMISLKRQKEFVLGHVWLRRLLCDLFNADISQACVETMPTGALSLPYMPNTYASISHTEERLAIAIGDAPLGLDIEYISDQHNFPALLNQIDAVEKAKELIASGMSVQDAFYHLWCRREALYKLNSFVQTAEPFLYDHKSENYMLCLACQKAVEIDWIMKKGTDYV